MFSDAIIFYFLPAQVLYGFYMAAEVAYFTYMYAKVEKEKYQKVTGNARASQQVGRFVASVMAQLLISYEMMNVRELNYITFGSEWRHSLVKIFQRNNFHLFFSTNCFSIHWNLLTCSQN